jgi:putative photosynthetic complex assembly protein
VSTATATVSSRLPAFAATAILGGVVVLCGVARLTGYASNASSAPAAAYQLLSFSDMPDGSVAIYRAGTNQVVDSIAAQGGAFLRTTVRALDGVRARENISEAAPFKLAALDNAHFALTDTATGQMIDLEDFGPSNENQFGQVYRAAAAAHP